ncbi:MAG: nitrile hydratase subunit beta [Betaproteobacteria bacterium]|nr:nitrile hydratase subunit beta [Betaproteobacteria bacterium]
MRRHHDLGGTGDGPVDTRSHDPALWEKRVDAVRNLLGHKKLLTTDEHRRHIEDLTPEDYDRLSYYERWILSLSHHLIERGIFTADELGRKMAEVEAREAKDREQYK